MSIASPLMIEKTAQDHSLAECRVYPRYGCHVHTSCQPASVREMRELRWSATICDISQGGVGLKLERRFERGSALAVELPGDEQRPGSVVFVRVMFVKRNYDGLWHLGCQFISELSDDDVQRLLAIEPPENTEQAPRESAPPAPIGRTASPGKATFSNIRIAIEDRSGASFRMTIKQLNVANRKCVAPGLQLRIVGGSVQGKPWSFQIEVDHLEQIDHQWKLRGFLVQPRAVADLVQLIKLSKQPIA